MKNYILSICILLFAFSCRNASDEVQKIDQIAKIYIDSLGVDMLNSTNPNAYQKVELFDLGGIYDKIPISTGFSIKKDKNAVSYLEYVSGAKRNLKEELNPSLKYYESQILLKLSKTINKRAIETLDTLKIGYKWTPQVFKISEIYYDNKLKFTKSGTEENVVKILK